MLLVAAFVASLVVLAPPTPPRCFPVRDGLVVDGDLADWDRRGPIEVDARSWFDDGGAGSQAPKDSADGSLVAYLGFDAEYLYLAGEVKDDSRVYDDRLWFNGDCIELFLDSDRAGDAGNAMFDEDDFELCLMPYNAGRSWGVVKHGRKSVLSDGNLKGVVVATKPAAAAGYTFEARIPWSNFPRFDSATRSVGIAIAQIDVDAGASGAVERSFLIHATREFVYSTTKGLLPLEFVGEPRARVDSAGAEDRERLWIRLLEGLAAVMVIVLVARYANVAFERVYFALRRARKPLVLALVALAILLFVGPELTTRAFEAMGRERFHTAASIVGRTIGELNEREAMGRGAGIDRPDQVIEILRGRAASQPPGFDYSTIDLRPIETAQNFKRSAENVPVREYGFPLESQRQYYFSLPRATVLSRLFVFGRSRFDAAERERPGVSFLRDQAIDIGVRLVDGKLRSEAFPAVDRTLAAAPGEPRTVRHQIGYETEGGVVEQYFLGAPTISNTLVQAIVVTLRDPAIDFELFGITFSPADAPSTFVPMPLVRASLAGPVSAFFDGYPRGVELTVLLSGEGSIARFPVAQRLDTLWFFYDSLDPRALDPALRGVEVGRFVARDATGAEHIASLRAGVNVFHGLYDAVKRPSDTDSRVAFRWNEEPGETRRIEMLELALPGAPLIEEIRFENKGPLTALSLYSVTGGVRSLDPTRVGSGAASGSVESPALAAELDAAGIAIVVGDSIAACDFGDEAKSRSLLGARPPFDEAIAGSNDGGEQVVLFGEPYRGRSFALPRPDGQHWSVLLLSPVPGVSFVARAQRHGFLLALLLGLPLAILFALDFGARIARLGPRLTTLLVATSLTPIVILFAVLYDFVADDRARLRESRADAVLREVENRIEAVLEETKRVAEQVAASDALRAVRPDAPLDETSLVTYLADVVAVRQASARGVDLAVRLEVDVPGGQRVRIHDRPESETMSRFDLNGRGAFVHWDQLVFVWTQDSSVGAVRRRVTVAAEIRKSFLDDLAAVSGVSVALLGRDSRPLAGSSPLDFAFDVADSERLRRTNRPLLRPGKHGELNAIQWLSPGEGEPAALLCIGLPRDEFLIDVLVTRLPLERFFFWFCVVGLAAAVFMGSVATSRITVPMERLETAVRRIGEGELEVRVDLPENARGEVARLAEAFNTMARELHVRSAERKRLERALSTLNAEFDVDPTASAALAVLAEQPPALGAAIYVRDSEHDRWLRSGSHSAQHLAAPAEIPRSKLFDIVAKRRAPLVLPRDLESLSVVEPSTFERTILEASSAVMLPLLVSDRCVGMAILEYGADVAATALLGELDTLQHLSGQVAVSLENAKLFQLAVIDPETGLYVESSFRTRFAEEVDRAHRRESSLALLLIAVEGVRRLERAQGADALREALARLGRFLKASSRDMIVGGRLGTGFALVSPETDAAHAEQFRQRLLREFAALDGGMFGESTNLHLHIGIAVFPHDGASSVYLFDAATRAIAASRRARMSEALLTPQGAVTSPEFDPAPFVFLAPFMRELLSQIARVAQSNASVLVLGETGTGKEVVAELLHRFSDRSHKPLVALNCSAVPENLLEAELFGYERGAFTGAMRAKPGQFEMADGGTLFLDEVGDLPLALQSKLLRVLQDRLVVRLGARKGTEVDVRIVAATNRDLREMMEQGRFRADLYFRLKVVSLVLPALRDRREDIPALVELFLRQFNSESGRPAKSLAPATLDALHGYGWPGNVRELRNVLSRALLMSEGDVVLPSALEFEPSRSFDPRADSRTPPPGSSTPKSRETSPSDGDASSTIGEDGLNERQRRFLATLERGRSVRSRDYFERVGVTSRTGLRDLADLVRRGLLVRDGRRRGAAYRLPDPEGQAAGVVIEPPSGD